MPRPQRVSDELLASLAQAAVEDELSDIARELIERRAADVVTVPMDDIDDFNEVTKEMPEALLAHLRAASALESP
jgi:hypothetical protein